MSEAAINPPSIPEAPADVPDTQDGAEATEAPADEAKASGATPRRFKVKVDESEAEVDEQELIRGYQRAQAANKRFEEAASIRKKAEAFLQQLRTNPRAILSNPKLGIDLKQLAMQVIQEDVEEQVLTPEERQRRDEQAELRRYREQEEAARRKMEEEREGQLREQLRGDYEKQLMGALEKGGIPKTPGTVKRMVDYMAAALQKGYEMSMEDVAELVREDYQRDIRDLLGPLDGALLEQLLGQDVVSKVHSSSLAKAKSAQRQAMKQPSQAAAPQRGEPRESTANTSDFLRKMREAARQGR